jgi:hypothetical protein
MLWLFAQVWVWLVVALLLGVLAGWLFWARPLRRHVAELEAAGARTPPARTAA